MSLWKLSRDQAICYTAGAQKTVFTLSFNYGRCWKSKGYQVEHCKDSLPILPTTFWDNGSGSLLMSFSGEYVQAALGWREPQGYNWCLEKPPEIAFQSHLSKPKIFGPGRLTSVTTELSGIELQALIRKRI